MSTMQSPASHNIRKNTRKLKTNVLLSGVLRTSHEGEKTSLKCENSPPAGVFLLPADSKKVSRNKRSHNFSVMLLLHKVTHVQGFRILSVSSAPNFLKIAESAS